MYDFTNKLIKTHQKETPIIKPNIYQVYIDINGNTIETLLNKLNV